MVLVGATIVGAIGTRWQGDIKRSTKKQHFDFTTLSEAEASIRQGEEMGYFKLGSTVVLLFAEGEQISWCEGLQAGSSIRYGQAFARSNQ